MLVSTGRWNRLLIIDHPVDSVPKCYQPVHFVRVKPDVNKIFCIFQWNNTFYNQCHGQSWLTGMLFVTTKTLEAVSHSWSSGQKHIKSKKNLTSPFVMSLLSEFYFGNARTGSWLLVFHRDIIFEMQMWICHVTVYYSMLEMNRIRNLNFRVWSCTILALLAWNRFRLWYTNRQEFTKYGWFSDFIYKIKCRDCFSSFNKSMLHLKETLR